MLLHALTISISSFLIFLVQPLIAKFILPWFGGSASVWSVCILFFQAGLLGGYVYAHVCATRLSLRHQALAQMTLLAFTTGLLPIIPNYSWAAGFSSPTLNIFAVLLTDVALPYLILA